MLSAYGTIGHRFRILTALALLVPALASQAQENGGETGEDWSFRLGAGAYSSPEYTGSDEMETLLFPSIDVSYRDIFFASLLDGIGFNVIRRPQWGATVSGQIVLGREAEGDIEALDEIDDRLMPKLETWVDVAGVRLHAAVIGDGIRHSAEAGLQRYGQPGQRTVYMVGGGARWNDKAWNDERFSVTASQATGLGVEPYAAESSVSEGYIEGALIYYFTPEYLLETAVELSMLTGDAADSPITRELGRELQPLFLIRFTRSL